MTTEVLESAIAQALEELQALKKTGMEQNQLIKKLIDKIEKLEEGYHQQEAVSFGRMQSCQTMMESFTNEVKTLIMVQPKSVVKQIRILLFPEQNAREYYRLVFGKILYWMTIFLISSYLFVLVRKYIDDWKTIKEKQSEQSAYESAWEYLYQHEDKQHKKQMNDAWQKATDPRNESYKLP